MYIAREPLNNEVLSVMDNTFKKNQWIVAGAETLAKT